MKNGAKNMNIGLNVVKCRNALPYANDCQNRIGKPTKRVENVAVVWISHSGGIHEWILFEQALENTIFVDISGK